MTLPYATATSGRSATDDIRKILQAFGCTKFAPMEDFAAGAVTIQFEYRGRLVQVTASAKGYAAALMKRRKRTDRPALWSEKEAIAQGHIAVWSIIRDWIKGQITAIETGVLSFEGAFLGQILLPTGETVLDRISSQGLLPPPDASK